MKLFLESILDLISQVTSKWMPKMIIHKHLQALSQQKLWLANNSNWNLNRKILNHKDQSLCSKNHQSFWNQPRIVESMLLCLMMQLPMRDSYKRKESIKKSRQQFNWLNKKRETIKKLSRPSKRLQSISWKTPRRMLTSELYKQSLIIRLNSFKLSVLIINTCYLSNIERKYLR